ncbi:RnfH family protein [Ideonella sp. YS5]|uniref:RnfH family protein n=1 Tax=Ideonella sp. YS5 TaxID=3453714 RepID=UPI003EEEA5B4
MARVEEAVAVKVQVSYSPAPRRVDQVELDLPPGSRLADALRASGLLERHGLRAEDGLSVGIWGKAKPLDTPVREADRIEIYRGLTVDPKEARRQRYRKHKR